MVAQLKEVTVSPPLGTPVWFVDAVEKAQDEPSMKVISLSPTLAKFMLDVNLNNRPVRQTKVAQYSADMAAGNWALNGEPIIVSKDGNLNDGQHRLLAVVDSNTSVPATLIFGVERETRLTVDQGSNRSSGDILGLEGVHNALTASAISRMVIAYEHDHGSGVSYGKYVTTAQIRERVGTDEAIAVSARFAHANYPFCKRFVAASLVGFCHYVLSAVHQDEAKAFLEQVCRGEGLKIGEAAHSLREKLMEGRVPRERKISAILRAWNYHRRSVRVSVAKLDTDLPFPALL